MPEEVTTTTTKKKSRRKRRSKAEVAAEKAAKAQEAEVDAAKEAEGFEKVRARDDSGHFIADDPSTPENESWEWQPKEEPQIEEVKNDEVVVEMLEQSVVSEEVVEEEPAPVVQEPAVSEDNDPIVDGFGHRLSEITNRHKRRKIQRRLGL